MDSMVNDSPAPATVATRGPNFAKDEQIALCHSWLKVSEDPLVGNDQRGSDFWNNVATIFNQKVLDLGKPGRSREANALQIHWRDTVKKLVSKFCGSYKKATLIEKSGYTEKDYIDLALQIYSDSCKKPTPFKLLHCWAILKDKPKWIGCTKDHDTPVVKRSVSVTDFDENNNTPSTKDRPIGNKKAKMMIPNKATMSQAIFNLKKEFSENTVAELKRKNDLIEEMNAIDIFRNEEGADAEEFRQLTRQNYLLAARLKLVQTKLKLEEIEKQ